jgi:hypothetical protein
MNFSVSILILVLGLAFASGTSASSQYSKLLLSSDEQTDTHVYNVEIDNDLDTLVDNPSILLPLFCCTSSMQVFYWPVSQDTLIQQARAPPQLV